jgi:LPS-assembly protein
LTKSTPFKKSDFGRWAGFAAAAVLLAWSANAMAFVEKPFKEPVIKKMPKSAKVDVDASRIVYDPRTEIATATGTVVLIYGPYKLQATKVSYNRKTGVLKANGSVVLQEPNGNSIEADRGALDLAFRNGFAEHVKALLTNDVTITAEYMTRKDGRYTIFDRMRYTPCKDCNTRSGEPLWEIVAETATHDQNTRTIAYDKPRLKLAGATIGALPYLEMADPGVKRRTGFLIPTYKYTDYMGFGAVTPFFWAPAPNYDVTLRPMWTSYQGPVADVEWRHRLRSGQYNLRGFGAYQLDPRESAYDDGHWRGALKSSGRFRIDRDWQWGWDGTIASDPTFLRRYGYDYSKIAYNDIYLNGLWDETYVDARAWNFEPLDSDISEDRLPFAMPYFEVDKVFPDTVLGGDVRFTLSAYSVLRDEASDPFVNVEHGTQQSRTVADLSWKNELTSDMGHLMTTFARVRTDIYVSEDVGSNRGTDTVARVLPSAGVDWRWPFIGTSAVGNAVITPVAQIIAATDETDTDVIGNEDAITLNFDHTSLFLEDRFTGYDRHESGVRANLGLTYDFLHDSGAFVRASAGESFHLAGENSFVEGSGLEGSSSDLVAALAVSPFNGFSMGYEGRLEEDFSEFNRHELTAGLSFDRFTANAGYLFIREEPSYGRLRSEEFTQANVRYGLTDGWYVFGGASYDLQNEYFRNKNIGIEFDCDCLNAKLSYAQVKGSRNDKTDHRIFFAIDFATLGGTSVATRF